MLRLATLLCLTTACLGNPLDIPDGKIVGGMDVDIAQYPYQLSMQNDDYHICGASIISEYWAVTAAHCSYPEVDKIFLRAGSSIQGSNGSVHEVDMKIIHDQYNSSRLDYDITLLRVTNPFVFGPGVAAVDLPYQDEAVAIGADSEVSGWGALTEGGSAPSQLQAVTIPVVSQFECQSAYGISSVTPRMICAGLRAGGKDSCQGDSGGPMVSGGKLVGIVSWGFGCARPEYPGIYSRVASMRDWINQNTGI